MSTPQYDGYPQPNDPSSAAVTADDRNNAGLIHLLGGIFGIIIALILWLVFKDKSAFVDAEGKKAVNFQIFVAIGWIVGIILSVILALTPIGFFGPLINFAIWVVSLIFGIKNYSAVKAGQPTSYPIDVALVK